MELDMENSICPTWKTIYNDFVRIEKFNEKNWSKNRKI